MNKVSVIIPVYNVEKYLPRTIGALLNQTYQNLEIILVDDCSKDGSRRVMEEYAAGDRRIRCFFQDPNQGVSEARNRGLDAVTGDWVCFCDGDDWYEPEFVEKMLSCAETEGADYIICDYQIAVDGKPPVASGSTGGLTTGCDPRVVIACGPVSSCTHMFRKELFDVSGARYPKGCRQYEELPVVPALAKFASRIGVVSEPLYNYYQRGDGTSASNTATEVQRNFLIGLEGLRKILGDGYEKELEYHAIYALHYGEILALCKQGAGTKKILQAIALRQKEYPDYLKNPYVKSMGIAKRMFLLAQKLRLVFALRIFAKIHSVYVH